NEANSHKTIRRYSTPATELLSVTDELTLHAARETASNPKKSATVGKNLTAMLLQHRNETRILPHRIPERVDLQLCHRHLRRPGEQSVNDRQCLVVFADDHINLREVLRADGAIERIHAFRE